MFVFCAIGGEKKRREERKAKTVILDWFFLGYARRRLVAWRVTIAEEKRVTRGHIHNGLSTDRREVGEYAVLDFFSIVQRKQGDDGE